MTLPHPELGAAWRAARPRPAGVHLDSAACSRQSAKVLDAVAHHARHEAEVGGYVAEESAEMLLQQGRSVLAGLVGMAAADVSFTESASSSIRILLDAWSLPAGSRIGVLPGEYHGNLAALAHAGLDPLVLPADDLGRLDLDATARLVRADPPAAVHLTVVASHRGVVQPWTELSRLCRATGVPLVVDAAQALGQVDCDVPADVVYGTSRKWLAGPRGVGFLVTRPGFRAGLRPVQGDPADALSYETHDAHVAGRVGLTLAIGEHLAAGPVAVRERLAGIGRAVRERLVDVPGWTAVEPLDEPTASTTLTGPDVVTAHARLRAEHGVVTTLCLPARAPGELAEPVLRVSPHLDVTDADLDTLVEALRAG
ncbi:ergothioneine biosynthesis PLP-dependent enzyme EgtE [Klenkia brasiliensis]|uniref:Probable hercynylcysteine sulfoxide lyase n=1 Tax=Klenkia brasiliensis TaxID=333142 RepID=A0A1G7NE74_9ACTN|nr:ergothioneine biosynthesis PLP-dependent enzyme EgtE [Klenkia brasiliensis]SDF72256.1 pyridoxal 5-phosphate dependent beta-lyase [Klenkia brasiliensis]